MVKSKELDNDSNLLLFLSLLKPCPPLQHETYQKSFVFAHVGLDRYALSVAQQVRNRKGNRAYSLACP